MDKDMKELFEKIAEIRKRNEEEDKRTGRNFNIFKTIGLTTEEVCAHSKFLAELLNPKGSHGQGDVFLKIFCEIFKIENLKTTTSSVEVEKHVGEVTETTGGRIDIFIDDHQGNSFTIENKIYAEDQNKQLVRYHNYKPNNIFYLTLFGDEPSKESKGHLEQGNNFKLLSYRTDIIAWLVKCRKTAIDQPLIREGIAHYIDLIKHLTGQSNNTQMIDEMKDLLISSPKNLETAVEFNKAFIAAKAKTQWLFWEELREEFKNYNLDGKKIVFEYGNNVTEQMAIDYYSRYRGNRHYGLYYIIKTYPNEQKFCFGIEIENSIYHGFFVHEKGNNGISGESKFSKHRAAIQKQNKGYTEGKEFWLGWKYFEPRLNFADFNSDAIFSLVDEGKRK